MTAPSGTVTFLFTDIEGSTKRWARDREAMQRAVRLHDRLMREAARANGGYVFKTVGDAFCIAFAAPAAAGAAALDAQRALADADFTAVDGLHVRMALDTGTADERDGDYFGPTLNFVARLLPLGHGGQILLSSVTAQLVRDSLPPRAILTDLGEHELKDIEGRQRVYQLASADLRRLFPELRSQQSLQPWMVPEAMRTRYFTGRDELLERLRRQLTEERRAALSGLGGAGKTQTAIEYAVRHRASYPNGVFWVDAQTVGGLIGGYVEIAKALHLPTADSTDQDDAVNAALARLNHVDGWLLILDNVEDRHTIRRFVPERDRGEVLITSRESVFAELGIQRALDVGDLDRDASVRFLLARAGHKDAEAEGRSTAAEIAAELGDLPLALEQAAAYIAETGAEFATYLSAFRKRRLSLLERAFGLVSHDTVAVTWAANFEAVARTSPAAAEVLRLSAFLAPDSIPYEVFSEGARAMGGPIAEALAESDDLAMSETLRSLRRYSLVRTEPASRVFGVHRLVQEIATAALSDEERRAYVGRAVCALDAVLPEIAYANWTQCERIVPHVTAIARWTDEGTDRPETLARIMGDAGKYLRERGRYTEAQPHLERALALREKTLGPDHPDVAASLSNLALLYRDRGRYAEGQRLQERAVAIEERVLGPDHPDVANYLNNLANLQRFQGRFAEAQSLHERTLAIREKALGPDHPDVAKSLANLALLHSLEGRYAESQSLHERTLAILEEALGADHPDVTTSLTGLAVLHHARGRYAEAQSLFERALAIREKALGPSHLSVAASLHNLAVLHFDQGHYAQAQTFVERALLISEKAVGADHPDFALSLNGLAELHFAQGRFAEAQPLYERALAVWEKALGPNHPDIADAVIGLANVHASQHRYSEARMLYQRALAIKERAYAADHPEVRAVREKIDTLRSADA